jgi:hypothetical protein
MTTFRPELFGEPERSYRGMAHLAGSGPLGATCGRCTHWDFVGSDKGRCEKYSDLTGRAGRPVPTDASACKYYFEAVRMDLREFLVLSMTVGGHAAFEAARAIQERNKAPAGACCRRIPRLVPPEDDGGKP